jgi:lipopolysaccharide transport system permease protein
VISSWRDIFYEQRIPSWQPLLSVAAISLVVMWISTTVFERRREEFAELV